MDFSNSFAINNDVVNDHYGEPVSWFTFVSHWATGRQFDVKASFGWGVGDVVDPDTYQTTYLEFSPYIDLYGYWNGYWKAWSYLGYLSFSTHISPFDTHLIDFSLQFSNDLKFWDGMCLSLSSSTKSVHVEINIAWSFPNCSAGLLESWWIPILENRPNDTEICPFTYFGYGHGNDTPLWSHDFIPQLDNLNYFVPRVCFPSLSILNPECARVEFQPLPEYCDKNEPNCFVGCDPFSVATNFDC